VSKITLVGALLMTACSSTPTTGYNGHNIYEYFPLDGNRAWTYAIDDNSLDYLTYVEKTDVVDAGGTKITTLEYRQQPQGGDGTPGDLLYSIDWSSDSAAGIVVYGYSVQGAESVTYDQPVQFADYQMATGDTVTTDTNGTSFTATMVGMESCTNLWTSETWDCVHMNLDDGDGDDSAGPPFAGDWWLAGSWGASSFQNSGATAPWVLTLATFCDPSTQDCG